MKGKKEQFSPKTNENNNIEKPQPTNKNNK